MSDLSQDTRPLSRVAPRRVDPRQSPPPGRHHIAPHTQIRHLAARYLPEGERFQQLARALGPS